MQSDFSVRSHRRDSEPLQQLLPPERLALLPEERLPPVAEGLPLPRAPEQSYDPELVAGSQPGFLFLLCPSPNLRQPHLVEAEAEPFSNRARLAQRLHRRL
jgi:hypothetical protein